MHVPRCRSGLRPLLFAVSVGCQGLLAPAAAADEDCATCHEEVVKQFALSPHGMSFAFEAGYKGGGCESCHGPGAAHVESGGDPAEIANPATEKPDEANAACLSCHQNRAFQSLWQASPHEIADLRCADCHAVHAAQPAMRADGTGIRTRSDVCLTCHTAARSAVYKRSTHPLREGEMGCASCHNPHGSDGDHLLMADSVNDLCYSCHPEKRGPFLWEHSPVRENCLTCHTPHGSNNDRMLVSRTVQLCQACHLQGRHQTVAGTETAYWNINRQCANCHPQIHGSNHPSGPLFQR